MNAIPAAGLQLSLFGDDDGPAAPPPARPAGPAVAPAAVAGPAPAAAPPELLPRHPRAQREALLAGHRVGYEFRRARRRSIGFQVGLEGLVVSAPRWVPLADVDAALQEKARWIVAKLAEQRERARRLARARVDWCDGTTLPFLGETVIVVVDPRTTGVQLRCAIDALPGVERSTLHVGLPHGAAPEQLRDAVHSWLQRQARRIFEERCAEFAARLEVRVRRLSLSSAATRWGSAGADGSVRLNWRLVHFALPVIDYVVAHELAHLREMHHGPAFWDIVRGVMPDYEAARTTLNTEVLPDLG